MITTVFYFTALRKYRKFCLLLYLLYYSDNMVTKYHVSSKLLLLIKQPGETCAYFSFLWDAILANFAECYFLILMLSSYTDIEIPYTNILVLILTLKSLYWNHLQLILWKCKVFTCFNIKLLPYKIDIVQICMLLVFLCKTGSAISALREKWTFLILKHL